MIKDLRDKKTNIDKDTFIAESAHALGNVTIGKGSSLWYGVVVRGDMNSIEIGQYTNVQDNAVLHVDSHTKCKLGDYVSVGHSAIVHGCEIGDNTLVGMGSIVMDNAKVGKNCIVAAGSIVTEGKVIPDNSLVMGIPGRVVREVTEEEVQHNIYNAKRYSVLGPEEHMD